MAASIAAVLAFAALPLYALIADPRSGSTVRESGDRGALSGVAGVDGSRTPASRKVSPTSSPPATPTVVPTTLGTPVTRPSPETSATGRPTPTSVPSPVPPEPPRTPRPPKHGTLCGAAFLPEAGRNSAEELLASDDRYGGLDAVRVFYTEPSPWPGRAGRPGRPVIVSLKLSPSDVLAGRHDATVRDWFATAPEDRDIYWAYHHEPEDNIEKGEFTAADYRTAWARLDGLATAADKPRLRATLILMDWTLDERSGRDWRDYYPGDDVIDVFGFDVYNHGYRRDPPIYLNADYQLKRIVAHAEATGKRFGIAELGAVTIPGDEAGTGRAAWLTDMVDYLVAHDALWVSYFDIDYENSDYRLRDDPSITVWRDFCTGRLS